MTPTLTLFLKEFRQHWLLAGAAVVICLLVQAAYCWIIWQSGLPVSPYEIQTFILQALTATVIYAGVAAAISYSTEHANKTFIFLRKLPVSHTVLAAGKIGWALCGTGLVLIANLLLCAGWFFFLTLTDAANLHVPDFNSDAFLNACAWFFLIITKVFFWGLLWSTLCRSQMNAVAATGASVMLVYGGFFYVCHLLEVGYAIVIPLDETSAMIYHLVEIVLVASLALWRVFRWFDFEARESRTARLLSHKVVLFRYPKQVQSPFAALVHHHLRHAGTGYHFGILSCVVFSAGFLFLYCYLPNNAARWEYTNTWWWICGAIASVSGIFILWGAIFGHDLKNNSYLFLSRMGVPEGTFWWSRIVPAMLLYVLVLVSVVIGYLVDMGIHRNAFGMEQFWAVFAEGAPTWFVGWLALPAMGAFFSLSFRSQIVAFMLTAGGAYALAMWMMFFLIIFGFSPLWTTLPICIALFVASRLRARYWFKETFTWRSRFIPLVPLFATVLAILIAVPFVRVHSVPNVSWSQIETYFDQAHFDWIDGGDIIRAPEKRNALLRHIAQHGTVPPEYEHWLELMGEYVANWELNAFSGITAEEYLLLTYVRRRNQLNDFFSGKVWRRHPDYRAPVILRQAPLMFWEKAREERVARLHLAAALAELGGIQDEQAETFRDVYERHNRYSIVRHLFWGELITAGGQRIGVMEFQAGMMSSRQLRHAFTAISLWYMAHGSLPESLDVLVEQGLLSAFPEHPFTGEWMQYHRDAPPPVDIASVNISALLLGADDDWLVQGRRHDPHEAVRASALTSFRESGGTHLRLGRNIIVLVVEERSQEEDIL